MNIFMYRCTYCSFCGHCYVTYWDIVGTYSYLVNASICKLSFCNSVVLSESHIYTCNIYHVTYKLCNQYSDVVISRNVTDRHVASIMLFHVSRWIDIVHYIIWVYFCYTRELCHYNDSHVVYLLYVHVTCASVRCVTVCWLLTDIFMFIACDLGTVCRNFV